MTNDAAVRISSETDIVIRDTTMVDMSAARMLAILMILTGRLDAQQPRDHGAPVAFASKTFLAIQIDGRPDEPGWLTVSPVTAFTAFTQVDPVVSEPTEVRLAYDADALYVSGTLRASDGVSTRLARRDQYLPDTDWFIVSLDTHHDHRSAYRFRSNPSGVKIDGTVSAGGEDVSWDPIW